MLGIGIFMVYLSARSAGSVQPWYNQIWNIITGNVGKDIQEDATPVIELVGGLGIGLIGLFLFITGVL